MSNYESLCETWRKKFLEIEHSTLFKKLPFLLEQGEYLTLPYYHELYGIHKENGKIKSMETGHPVSIDTCLNIYNLCWFCSPNASLHGKWVPFRDLQGASVFASAFQKNILEPLAMTFSGHTEELSQACEKLGGIKLPFGDVGYQIPSFPCMPLQVLFWDGDEEFPAKANLLFDDSATDFIHVETTVTIAADGLRRLIKNSGLPPKGCMYEMT